MEKMSYIQRLRTSLPDPPALHHIAPLSPTSLPSAAQIAPPTRADSALFFSLNAHLSRGHLLRATTDPTAVNVVNHLRSA
uniref:Uncharacterized protein n=1 Tax=Oryza meridionalis TaxID=40149 RepID=A0A0E0EPG6_9ORYZ